MEILEYKSYGRVARIVSGEVEIYVTLDVGPRIIRLGVIGGPNELVELPGEEGAIGSTGFKLYGGHRLWIAPEEEERTMQPDNDPVEFSETERGFEFKAATDKWGMRKELRIISKGDGIFRLVHYIYNDSPYDARFAPWALTMFAPGGTCYFPMPEFRPHTEDVLPDRPLVLWAYTNLGDPRFRWGQKMGLLRQDSNLGPQKIGMFVPQGFAAYANNGNLFIKRFEANTFGEGSRYYPDFGCNFETYTNEKFLEVESLGPLDVVPSGGGVSLQEFWWLQPGISVPADPDEAHRPLSAFNREFFNRAELHDL